MERVINIASQNDLGQLRSRFPVLSRRVNGRQLVYLDNAATTQKPDSVLSALEGYYSRYNANIHRGIHALAEEATTAFENTRTTIQQFLNAAHREEIIFTSGTTASINLVAATWARKNISLGDEIIITTMEHHSNIVPWQLVCLEKGATLKVVPVNDAGELDMEAFERMLNSKTRLVSIVHVSNALGTINPIEKIVQLSHAAGALVMVDGAQSAVHLPIDVQAMGCDFFALSAHKMYGPTGVGVLYGKMEILDEMPVYMGGGEMIKEVSFDKTTFNELPYKFEAGTPNIADVVAFGAALQFMTEAGADAVLRHEHDLLEYGTARLRETGGIRMIGTAAEKSGVLSFLVDGTHPQDVGVLLDQQGIAVRTGHHCTQPLMKRFGIPGTVRASFAMYNTHEEVDLLIEALQKAKKMLL